MKLNRPPSAFRAFTMIEMMVVLAIIAIMMGVGWGAMVSLQRGKGITAGAAMVEDLIRQARSTSLSTGRPVQIRFGYDDEQKLITGVSETPVFHLDFERDLNDNLRQTDALPGIAGYCLVAGYPGIEDPDYDEQPYDTVTNTDLDDVLTSGAGLDEYQRELYPSNDRSRPRLMVKDGDGWIISLWHKAPPLNRDRFLSLADHSESDIDNGITNPSNNFGRGYLPLIRIGTSDVYGDANAFIGIDLVPRLIPIQHQTTLPTASEPEYRPYELRYCLRGWVTGGGGLDNEVSDVSVSVGNEYHPTATSNGIPFPIDSDSADYVDEDLMPNQGGNWEHYALEYDGSRLKLWRNGINVGTADQTITLAKPANLTAFILYIGTEDDPSKAPREAYDHDSLEDQQQEGGLFDEIIINRIGNDSPAKLPSGMKFDGFGTITIGSGSRGAVSPGTSNRTITILDETTEIVVREAANPSNVTLRPRQAVITITTTGQVTSTIDKALEIEE